MKRKKEYHSLMAWLLVVCQSEFCVALKKYKTINKLREEEFIFLSISWFQTIVAEKVWWSRAVFAVRKQGSEVNERRKGNQAPPSKAPHIPSSVQTSNPSVNSSHHKHKQRCSLLIC
jgi:hypothetical protein